MCNKQKNQCNTEFRRYEACTKIICTQTLSCKMILLSDTIPFQFMNIFYDIPGVMNSTMNVSQNIYLSLSDKWLMFKKLYVKIKIVKAERCLEYYTGGRL